VAIGTDIDPVPVTGFALNFSPMPLMAPPPLGSETAGAWSRKSLWGESRCAGTEPGKSERPADGRTSDRDVDALLVGPGSACCISLTRLLTLWLLDPVCSWIRSVASIGSSGASRQDPADKMPNNCFIQADIGLSAASTFSILGRLRHLILG